MLGLLLENGPLRITETGSVAANNVSWDKLVDYIWIDQPVYVPASLISCARSNSSFTVAPAIQQQKLMGGMVSMVIVCALILIS
jgi:hypothetical protein